MPVSSSFIQKPQGKSHLPLGTSGVDETLRVPGHTVEPPGQVGFRLPGAKSQGRFNRDLTWHLVAISGKKGNVISGKLVEIVWEIGGNMSKSPMHLEFHKERMKLQACKTRPAGHWPGAKPVADMATIQ